MMRQIYLMILCAIIDLLTTFADVRAQTASSAALIEAARKEGQAVFYTPLNINDSRPLLQRFEQKYPFIKTDLLRMSAEPLLNRIEAGIRAFDPCLSCSTHALGQMALQIQLLAPDGKVLDELSR